MRRRTVLSLAALLPIPFLAARLRPVAAARAHSADLQQEAVELNALATNIASPANARRLIDRIAEIFSEQLPPGWTTRTLRNRMAQAEFAAATDPSHRVSEQRIVTAWNSHAETINAPETTRITVPELHNLRDALFASAQFGWNRSYKNIWSIPAIFATNADGSMAYGCRVVETLRLLWDLANMPDNLESARVRVQHGILISELFRQAAQRPPSQGTQRSSIGVSRGHANPVEVAARQYVQDHGIPAYIGTVETMLNIILTPISTA